MKITLTNELRESEPFNIEGEVALLITGDGSAQIHRSIADSPFFPITDSAGEPVTFFSNEEGLLYNGEYSSRQQGVKFKIVAETADEINVHISGW